MHVQLYVLIFYMYVRSYEKFVEELLVQNTIIYNWSKVANYYTTNYICMYIASYNFLAMLHDFIYIMHMMGLYIRK